MEILEKRNNFHIIEIFDEENSNKGPTSKFLQFYLETPVPTRNRKRCESAY